MVPTDRQLLKLRLAAFMERFRTFVKGVPVVGPLVQWIAQLVKKPAPDFPGTIAYWEGLYASGGTSGRGSYGEAAKSKARTVSSFAREHGIESVIEFGCGDGNTLSYTTFPKYTGVDVSSTAIDLCRKRHGSDASKRFIQYDPNEFDASDGDFESELSLSLDVIYHLVEDEVFDLYMTHLFAVATRYVVILSSDHGREAPAPEDSHMRHRHFTRWVAENRPDWRLLKRISASERLLPGSYPFYFYERVPRST